MTEMMRVLVEVLVRVIVNVVSEEVRLLRYCIGTMAAVIAITTSDEEAL